MPVTTGLKPHGFYDQHSAPQLQAIYAVLPWLLDAIASMGFSNDAKGPVLAPDFGSSEGRNSVAAMHQVAAAIRRRTNRPIQTVHSDLPLMNAQAKSQGRQHSKLSVDNKGPNTADHNCDFMRQL